MFKSFKPFFLHNLLSIFLAFPFSAWSIAIGSEEAAQFKADLASGTLPIIYIYTEEGASVVDKVTKIPATMWIEIPENCAMELEPVGSKDKPLTLTIKGRGNSSWTNSEKKPYKLKLDKKTALLGMPKHKHWALLANALGYSDQFVNTVGFALGKELGMPWVPGACHVEVVLNDEYIGLYSLTESVKIDPSRIDIYEQPEDNKDEDTIPYGWLVEIDNYNDEFQIIVPEFGNRNMRVTHKSPELLSDAQRNWLTNEFTELNKIIYSTENEIAETWSERIDAVSMVRYFIARELLMDFDGYNGSMYLHRDAPDPGIETAEKPLWHLGPLWDMGFNGTVPKTCWAFEDSRRYGVVHWVQAVSKTKVFRDTFYKIWEDIYPQGIENAIKILEKEGELCKRAEIANNVRWPKISASTSNKIANLINSIRGNGAWIEDHKEFLGQVSSLKDINVKSPLEITTSKGEIQFKTTSPIEVMIYNITGVCVARLMVENYATISLPRGVYIVSGGGTTQKVCF